MITYFTDKQILVEKWLNQMGFQTDLERVYGSYCCDIALENDWVVEIDGPRHYPKEILKRDIELKNLGVKEIIHVPIDISKDEFKKLILIKLKEGKDILDKND